MMYDLIILGGGPAGLTAAIYMARAKYKVLVIEKDNSGSQIEITENIVNYPGIEKISGIDFMNSLKRQAKRFGAEIVIDEIAGIDVRGDVKRVSTKNEIYETLGIMIATGATPRKIGFTGEFQYRGRGVAYCATCDGEFFTGKEIFVIGGGFAAAQESIYLTRFAKKIRVIVRGTKFACAQTLADEVLNHPKIEVNFQTEVKEVLGENVVQKVVLYHKDTEQIEEVHAKDNDAIGVFVFAGYEPATGLFKDDIVLDEKGYIIVDKMQNTNVPGVTAAGDVCVKELRQLVTAVSDGAVAANTMEKYVSGMYEKLHLEPRTWKEELVEEYEEISPKESANQTNTQELPPDGDFFDGESKLEVMNFFKNFEQPAFLNLVLDKRGVSKESVLFFDELESLTEKLEIMKEEEANGVVTAEDQMELEAPYVEFLTKEKEKTGVRFHGIPGGHEIMPFFFTLAQASGDGQQLDPQIEKRIMDLPPMHVKILVSLSCHLCPEIVTAAELIGLKNPKVKVDVYDIEHFEEYQHKYQIMGVPCLVVNGVLISFGKLSLVELLSTLEKQKDLVEN